MDLAGSASVVRAVSWLTRLVTVVVVVALLARGRDVLLPIAFAIVLAFILTPATKWLQRRISRAPAIILVILLAVGALGSAGYVVAAQLDQLTTQLGTHTESMRSKVALLGSGAGPLARLELLFARITDDLGQPAGDGNASVHLMPAKRSATEKLWAVIEPLAEPLITTLFVLVLCAFMLAQRDDLRNRLIRLVGPANVTLTTRTLDETGQRITRYLLDQTMINAGFGVAVGTGLAVIGVPYPALWGAVAALARFVPYLGPLASMLMPAALAFAIFPGWSRALLTLALFLGLDGLTAYGIEPLLIGRRTGVSAIALLVSALFWTWLWGPLGLLLATPITVSLAVLGRHVPALQFLGVLLGDAQVIGTEISFYQRLLARDEDEAAAIAQKHQTALGPTGVMDQIIIPTLVMAARDLGRKDIAVEDEAFIVSWSRDIFEHLLKGTSHADAHAAIRALGIAAHRTESELLLEMLAVVVAPKHGKLEVLRADTSLDEVVARVERLGPEVVCIAALPPEGGPYARQLCQRLKGRFPALTVVAFRPNEPGIDPTSAAERLKQAGADHVVATLADASAEMSRLLGRAPARPPTHSSASPAV